MRPIQTIRGPLLFYFSDISQEHRLPRWLSGKESTRQCKETQETRVRSLSGQEPLEEAVQPTSVFSPGKSHGQRILMGYRLTEELPKSQTRLSDRACIPKNTPKEIHRNLNLHTYLSICLSTFLCVHFEKAKVLVTQSCLTLCCILQLSKLRPKRYSPSSCCRSCSARFKQLAWIWVSGDPLSNPNLTPNSLKQDPADLLILSRNWKRFQHSLSLDLLSI